MSNDAKDSPSNAGSAAEPSRNFPAELRVRRWGVVGLVLLTTLAVGTISLWLVVPYWLIMAWLLTPPGGWRRPAEREAAPGIDSADLPIEAEAPPAVEPEPQQPPPPAKPARRKRSRAKKKVQEESPAPNIEATWVRVGPNQFVRVEVPVEPEADPVPEEPPTNPDANDDAIPSELTEGMMPVSAECELFTPMEACESPAAEPMANEPVAPQIVGEREPFESEITLGEEQGEAIEVEPRAEEFQEPEQVDADPSPKEKQLEAVVADQPAEECEQPTFEPETAASETSFVEEKSESAEESGEPVCREPVQVVTTVEPEISEDRSTPLVAESVAQRFSGAAWRSRSWRPERGERVVETRRRPLVGARALPRELGGFSRHHGRFGPRRG